MAAPRAEPIESAIQTPARAQVVVASIRKMMPARLASGIKEVARIARPRRLCERAQPHKVKRSSKTRARRTNSMNVHTTPSVVYFDSST